MEIWEDKFLFNGLPYDVLNEFLNPRDVLKNMLVCLTYLALYEYRG